MKRWVIKFGNFILGQELTVGRKQQMRVLGWLRSQLGRLVLCTVKEVGSLLPKLSL